MVCFVTLLAWLLLPYWVWYALFHLPLWFIFTGHWLYCFISCFLRSSIPGMVYIVPPLASLVHHYWAWLEAFHFMLHWFVIVGHNLYYFTLCFTGSSMQSIGGIVSLSTLVLPYWTWLVLFYFILHWFIINGYCCIVSLHASVVDQYRALMELFHSPRCFFLAVHGLHIFISCFSGSSLLVMVCIVSLDDSLVYHCWLMRYWFFLTGYGMYCFTSITGSSLLCMSCILSCHASLVLPYRTLFVLFHIMTH